MRSALPLRHGRRDGHGICLPLPHPFRLMPRESEKAGRPGNHSPGTSGLSDTAPLYKLDRDPLAFSYGDLTEHHRKPSFLHSAYVGERAYPTASDPFESKIRPVDFPAEGELHTRLQTTLVDEGAGLPMQHDRRDPQLRPIGLIAPHLLADDVRQTLQTLYDRGARRFPQDLRRHLAPDDVRHENGHPERRNRQRVTLAAFDTSMGNIDDTVRYRRCCITDRDIAFVDRRLIVFWIEGCEELGIRVQ